MAEVGTLEVDADERERGSGAYAGYAVLEIMGHRRLAGFVREEQLGGVMFLRVDGTADDGTRWTQFYHPNSLFCLSPCDAANAQVVGWGQDAAPIQPYQVRDLVRQGVEAELARRVAFAHQVAEHAARQADDTEDDRDDEEPIF